MRGGPRCLWRPCVRDLPGGCARIECIAIPKRVRPGPTASNDLGRWLPPSARTRARGPSMRSRVPGDIESLLRVIEVKSTATSNRGWYLPLQPIQVKHARTDPDFHVYVVEHIGSGRIRAGSRSGSWPANTCGVWPRLLLRGPPMRSRGRPRTTTQPRWRERPSRRTCRMVCRPARLHIRSDAQGRTGKPVRTRTVPAASVALYGQSTWYPTAPDGAAMKTPPVSAFERQARRSSSALASRSSYGLPGRRSAGVVTASDASEHGPRTTRRHAHGALRPGPGQDSGRNRLRR